MKYKIVADASCDIPEEYLEKYDISIIPIEVAFGDEIYPEGLDKKEFYKKVKETNIIPKTAMPNAYKFEEFYKEYANKDDVFVLTLVISMEMSQTKLQAQMAAESLGMKNVFVEESGCTTAAQGAIICELCKFIEKEKNVDKIIEEFYRLKEKCKLYAIINDLKYLKNSGRLSSSSAIIGSMLNVKPIVSIVDGKVVNIAKCMGTIKAENYLFSKINSIDGEHDFYFIHSDNLEAIEKLQEKYKDKILPNQKITNCEIGCVVGSHVGPKCYGIVYFEK